MPSSESSHLSLSLPFCLSSFYSLLSPFFSSYLITNEFIFVVICAAKQCLMLMSGISSPLITFAPLFFCLNVSLCLCLSMSLSQCVSVYLSWFVLLTFSSVSLIFLRCYNWLQIWLQYCAHLLWSIGWSLQVISHPKAITINLSPIITIPNSRISLGPSEVCRMYMITISPSSP